MATPMSGATGASNRTILLAGIVGSVVFAGTIAFFTMRDTAGGDAPTGDVTTSQAADVAPTTPAQDPAPAGESATAQTGAVADQSVQAPAETAPAASAQDEAALQADDASAVEAPAPAAIAPVFDLVRVDADGNAVIAGKAAPGATVTLRLDGETLEQVTADAAGDFVAMLVLDPSNAARVLSLEAVAADGTVIAGAESVLIAPFAAPIAQDTAKETGDLAAVTTAAPSDTSETTAASQTASAAADTDAAAETAALSAAVTEDVTPAAATAPQAATQAEATSETETADQTVAEAAPSVAEAQAPAVLIAGQDGIRVAQGAETSNADAAAILLDAITYDEAGVVTLAGRGPAGADLQVSLDGDVVGRAQTGPTGQWSLSLPDVAPDTYTLRIEQRDEGGAVMSALETPFLREDPARIRDNPMLAEPGSSVITVQRGFTLWGIAEANFGNGILYVQIFQENRADIRDPDLIYPGQIFALPDLPRTAPAP